MSTFYPDLTLTQFPDRIDGRYLMIDPSTPEHIQWIAEYNACIDAGDMDGAIAVLEAHEDLRKMFFNAAKWNRHDDMIIALEKFFYQDVEEYLMDIVAWRGEWSPTTPYTKYDVVYYMHDEAYETYMGIVRDIPTGTLPTDTDYFVPITLRGQKGESGIGLTWRGAWKPQIQYYTDDCAVYDGKIYAAKQDSMGDRPDISPSSWESALWFNADSLTGIVKVENGGTGNDRLARGYVFEGNGQAPMIAHKIATSTPTAQSTDLLTSGIAYDKFLTKADNAVIVNVTVPASGWVNYQQTVTVPGVNDTNVVIASLQQGANREQRDVCWNATISIMGQGVNSVTLVCDGLLPRIDLPLTFAIMGEEGTTQADTVTDSLAQIQENASDIASLGSDIENMRLDINDNLTQQDERDDSQDEELMKRAGSLIDTIESKNNSVTFIADDTWGYLASLKIEGAHQYSSEEYSPTAPRTLTTTGQYDAMITLDGGDEQTWSGPTGTHSYFQSILTNVKIPINSGTGTLMQTQLASYGLIGNATQLDDRVYVYNSNGRLVVRINKTGITTIADLRAHLQDNPLKIWYQSLDFDTSNLFYYGISIADDEGSRGYAIGPTKPLLSGDTLDFISGEVTHVNDYYAMDGTNETVVMENGLFQSVNGTGESSRAVGSSTHYSVTTDETMPVFSIRRMTNSHIEISDSNYSSATDYNEAFLLVQKINGTPLKIIFNRNEPLSEYFEPIKIKVRGRTTVNINNALPLHMEIKYPLSLNKIKDAIDEIAEFNNILSNKQSVDKNNADYTIDSGTINMTAIESGQYASITLKRIDVSDTNSVSVSFDSIENGLVRIGEYSGASSTNWIRGVTSTGTVVDVTNIDSIDVGFYVKGVTTDVVQGENASFAGVTIVKGSTPIKYPASTAIDRNARESIEELRSYQSKTEDALVNGLATCKVIKYYDGYIASDGQTSKPTDSAEKYTSQIAGKQKEKIRFIINYPEEETMWCAICLYGLDGEFISRSVFVDSKLRQDYTFTYEYAANVGSVAFTYRSYNSANVVIGKVINSVTISGNTLVFSAS